MKYNPTEAALMLSRTPAALDTWLRGVPSDWLYGTEGPETWSPFDVVGHLVHGERADWIARAKIILQHGETRAFDPFDRFAQFQTSRGKAVEDLLDEFASLRAANLTELDGLEIGAADYAKKGKHPALGVCTLEELLSTWVVHDLNHISQIARVMAKQYAEEVGPWREYLPILQPRAKK